MVNYVKLSIKPETKKLVRECIPEFIKYNPKFKGMHISENHIISIIAEHYLQCQGL